MIFFGIWRPESSTLKPESIGWAADHLASKLAPALIGPVNASRVSMGELMGSYDSSKHAVEVMMVGA